jgi:hypothetical protein
VAQFTNKFQISASDASAILSGRPKIHGGSAQVAKSDANRISGLLVSTKTRALHSLKYGLQIAPL